ncbi:hypothetical protein A2U01_0060962, partial [Trifolium medium]|nr:hypothetical protein [Trifolium medium]
EISPEFMHRFILPMYRCKFIFDVLEPAQSGNCIDAKLPVFIKTCHGTYAPVQALPAPTHKL